MATVFARCPVDGLVPMTNIIGGSGTVQMIGNWTVCPRCGRSAPIVDGEYEMRDDLNLPTIFHPLTPAQGRRIVTAVQWAQREVVKPDSDEELIKQKIDRTLDREAPWLKKFIDAVLSTKAVNLVTILGFIMVVLTFFGADPATHNQDAPVTPAPGISEEQLREILDEYLESETGSDTPIPPSPEPEEPTPTEPPTQPA